MKKIEGVCTANHGRSPIFELKGNLYLRKIGADNEYLAISSGSSVDDIASGNIPIHVMKRFVEQALERGDVYTKLDQNLAKNALKDENEDAISYYHDLAVDRFQAEEELYRMEALVKFNIKGQPKKTHEQTKARSDTIAVLPMAERNKQQVETIYEDSGLTPIIETVGVFATGDPNAEVTDAFGKTKKDYFECIEQLLDYVPKAIDRLLESSN